MAINYTHFKSNEFKKTTYDVAKNTHILIKDLEELEKILEDNKDKLWIAWDTETTGLSFVDDKIVGFSFSFRYDVGYYVPIRHATGNNLEPKKALDLFVDFIKSPLPNGKKRYSALFNMRFDFRMLEKEGYDLSKVNYVDIAACMWLADTNEKFPNLKGCEKMYLGWNPMKFEEVLGKESDFHFLNPEDCYKYACVDAEGTYALITKALEFVKENGKAGKFENNFLYPLMKFEEELVKVDIKYIQRTIDYLLDIQIDLTRKIEMYFIENVGINNINIKAKGQLGDALKSIGIDTGVISEKSNNMKVDITTLEYYKNNNPDYNPIIDDIIELSKLSKLLSAYYEVLLKEAQRMNGYARFNYITNNVPTGRLACGGAKNNNYFTAINIQSAPKPHSTNWFVHKYNEGDEIHSGDEIVAGWRFSLTDKSDKIIGGFNPENNFRNCFTTENDEYWISVDYAAQELRILANISNEKNWIDTFNSGGDLHKLMAVKMWGEENYNKEMRKRAKAINFGLSYGMTHIALAKRLNISEEEAKEMIELYWKSVPSLKKFQESSIKIARETGTIGNWFGLQRRVKSYFDDKSTVGFGMRTVNNTVIQSVGACILKNTMLKLYKNLLFNDKYKDYVRFQTTVHDEINYVVKQDKLMEILPIIVDNMKYEDEGWEVPLEVEFEIGNRWGSTFGFHFNEDRTELIPNYEVLEGE